MKGLIISKKKSEMDYSLCGIFHLNNGAKISSLFFWTLLRNEFQIDSDF